MANQKTPQDAIAELGGPDRVIQIDKYWITEIGLAPSLGLDPILRKFLQKGMRFLRFSSGDIGLLDKSGKYLNIHAAVGVLDPLLPLQVESGLGVSGKVIRERRTIVVDDLTQNSDYVEILNKYAGEPYGEFLHTIRSTVKTPIIIDGIVIGVLCLHWNEPNAVHHDAVPVIEVLAETISAMIEAFKSKARTSWAQMVVELTSRPIKTGGDIAVARRELFQGLANEALHTTPAVCSNVRLYDAKDRTLRFVAVAGAGWTDKVRGRVYTVDEISAASYVVKTRQPFIIADTENEKYYKELFPDVRSHVSVPIIFRDDIAGVVSVDADRKNGFSNADLSNLWLLATQCSMMLEHFALIEESWLYELEIFLSSTREIESLWEGVMSRIKRLFGVKGCSIFLRYPSTDELRLAATTDKQKNNVVPAYQIGEGVTGWVAKHQRILRLRNTADKKELEMVSEDLKWKGKWNEDLDYSGGRYSFLGAPLTVGDELIGVLRLTIKEDGADFTYNDEVLINSLTARLALSVQNLWLTEERKRQVKQLQAFTHLVDKLTETLNPERVAQTILYEGLEIIGCDAGHIRVFNPIQRHLKLVAASGDYKDKIPEIRGLGEGISGRVAISRKPLIVPDVSQNKDCLEVLNEDFGQPQQEFLQWVGAETCYPLLVEQELVGTLNVHWSRAVSFGERELDFLGDLSNRGAIAIKAALTFEEIERELNRRVKAQSRLRSIGMEFAQTLNLDTLLNHVLEIALEEKGINSGIIRILDEHRNKWVLKAAEDGTPEPLMHRLLPELDVKDDILKRAADSEGVTCITDARNHPGFQAFVSEFKETEQGKFLESVCSMFIVPIRLRDHGIGLLILNAKEPNSLPDSAIRDLEIIAGQAAIAVDNAQLYAERERALQLAQPLAMLGSMLGSFLHLTRTPLHELCTTLDVVQHPKFDRSRFQEYAQRMREGANDLAAILKDIAVFARKEVAPNLEEVEVNTVLEKVIHESRDRSGGWIRYALHLADPSPTLKCNRVQLEQAFRLIIGNAIDAMPSGGNMLIETSYDASRSEIIVRFKDDGIGMDRQTKERCLEPFYTTKGKEGGTGLGLAVVYGIVTRHSGQIQIESEPGQGTTITLGFHSKEET